MSVITIMSIVVVAILTLVIFSLAWLGYSSCIKNYKAEVNQGKYDIEISKEFFNTQSKKKQLGLRILSYTLTCLVLICLISLFITGMVYKIQGENLVIDGKTVLVIKSGSMSNYYNEDMKNNYNYLGYQQLQFSTGDLCIFETVDSGEIKIGDVYGYKYRDNIITHRLIDMYESDGKIYYIFRGDNNPSQDQILISESDIIYHYTNTRIPIIGVIILFGQSYIGIWSIVAIIGITISSDVIMSQMHKYNKERANQLGVINEV